MNIYIDYDTTLVNLIDPWIDWINKKYNVTITSTDINRWYYLGEEFGAEADDFWRSEEYNHYTDKEIFKPYDDAVDFFHTVQEIFGVQNTYIVSSTKDHHKEEKIKHAKHYFNINERQFIPVSKEKHHITKDGILIDDYPLHVMEHIHYNKQKGIVFNYENRFGWSSKCNYKLDNTLDNFMHIIKDDNFTISTSYNEIIKELNSG